MWAGTSKATTASATSPGTETGDVALAGYALSLVSVALVTALLLAVQDTPSGATGQYVRSYGIVFLLFLPGLLFDAAALFP